MSPSRRDITRNSQLVELGGRGGRQWFDRERSVLVIAVSALHLTISDFYAFIATRRCASNWTMIGTGQGPLFFGGPRGPNSGISAEQKLVAADNFLQNSKNSRDARLRRATPATPPAARAGVATEFIEQNWPSNAQPTDRAIRDFLMPIGRPRQPNWQRWSTLLPTPSRCAISTAGCGPWKILRRSLENDELRAACYSPRPLNEG